MQCKICIFRERGLAGSIWAHVIFGDSIIYHLLAGFCWHVWQLNGSFEGVPVILRNDLKAMRGPWAWLLGQTYCQHMVSKGTWVPLWWLDEFCSKTCWTLLEQMNDSNCARSFCVIEIDWLAKRRPTATSHMAHFRRQRYPYPRISFRGIRPLANEQEAMIGEELTSTLSHSPWFPSSNSAS